MDKQNTKTLLWLGAGDLAHRCAPLLSALGVDGYFASRSKKFFGDEHRSVQANVTDIADLTRLVASRPTICVITMTPGGRREDDYRASYLLCVKNMLSALKSVGHAPRLVIFVSSTSVYHQAQGERVDEQSPAYPHAPNGRVLLECESLLQKSIFTTCSLRFSGIYGSGRHHLLKQVAAGNLGDGTITNRIHVDDCARSIAFLVSRVMHNGIIPPTLLATDNAPVVSYEVRRWLAEQMELDDVLESDALVNLPTRGKQCSNRLLSSLGFDFKYSSYKEGFPKIIDEFKAPLVDS